MGNTVPFGLLPRFGIDSRSVIIMPHVYGFTCYNTSEADLQMAENSGATASAVTRVLPIFPNHRFDAYAPFLHGWVDEFEFNGTISTVNALLQTSHPHPLCASACCMECILLGCCGDSSRDQLLTYPLLAERFLIQFSHERNEKRPVDQHVVWSLQPLVPGRGTSQHARQYPLVYLNIRLPVPSNQFVVSTAATGTMPHTALDGSIQMIPASASAGPPPPSAAFSTAAGPPQTPVMNRTLPHASVMPMPLPPTPQQSAAPQPLPQWQTDAKSAAAGAGYTTPQKLSSTQTSFFAAGATNVDHSRTSSAASGVPTAPYVRQNLMTQTATAQATGAQFTFTASKDATFASEAPAFCSRCGTARKDVHAQYCHKCGSPL